MIHKLKTIDMSREEWLEERKKSLGGSDMGAVLGLNKWRSPFVVWADKTGKLPETEDNEAMRQGRDLEGYVAQRFEEKSGKRVQMMNYILRSDDAPHLHANIDRRIVGEKSGLECKTASAPKKETPLLFTGHSKAKNSPKRSCANSLNLSMQQRRTPNETI